MKNIKLALGFIAGATLVGCSGGAEFADAPELPKSTVKQVKSTNAPQAAVGGVADTGSVPAPSGTQTGLPAGGSKVGG